MSYMELMKFSGPAVVPVHCHLNASEDSSDYCPTCGSHLENTRFRLVCRLCGYYVSSTD